MTAYSAPNHTTGDGLEVRNTYGDTLGSYGRLLKTEDRGARTEVIHDDWGRPVITKRTMAKPGAPIAALASRYTSHVFQSGTTLDDAGRLLEQTTGADVSQELEIVEVRVKDDMATADLDAVREDGQGPSRLTMTLKRDGEDWKISALQ